MTDEQIEKTESPSGLEESASLAVLTNAQELGDYLKAARKKAKLSIEQLHSATNIREVYLHAVEEGDLASLPGAVYTRAYYMSYAEALNIDITLTANRLFGSTFEKQNLLSPALEIPEQSPRMRRSYMFACVAVIAGVIFYFQQPQMALKPEENQAGDAFNTPEMLKEQPQDKNPIPALEWYEGQNHSVELVLRSPRPQQVVLEDENGLVLLDSNMRTEQVAFVPLDKLNPQTSVLTLKSGADISLFVNGVAFRLPEEPTMAGVRFRVWDLLALVELLPVELAMNSMPAAAGNGALKALNQAAEATEDAAETVTPAAGNAASQ